MNRPENQPDPERPLSLLDSLVESAYDRFMHIDTIRQGDKYRGYMSYDAAREAIGTLGLPAEQLFISLVRQTKLDPKEVFAQGVAFDADTTWPEALMMICRVIVEDEMALKKGLDHIQEINDQRDTYWSDA